MSKVRLAGGVLALTALAGCQSSAPAGPAFDDANAAPVTCMGHQRHAPTTDYTGGEKARTELVLRMLKYYSSNGTKGYCDHKPASATDKAWANLYVKLGAKPDAVAPILAS
ncbi:MAG: hypothetical protein NVSMB13_17890 [Mycobacteriales bacterium]